MMEGNAGPGRQGTVLLLVRHGQTEGNANGIMQGQTQGALTELGAAQAADVARRLSGRRIDAFLSSDLKRALDTCRIIAGDRAGEILAMPLLRERDWGSFTGRYIPDLRGLPFPPDVESLEAMLERASRFLDLVRGEYSGKTVLAVGHGITNRAIQAVCHGWRMDEVPRMGNAEVRELRL